MKNNRPYALTFAQMLNPGDFSARLAVASAAVIDANLAQAMIAKLKRARDSIEGADLTEAERFARYSAQDVEARPILAKMGIVWHSHILTRKIVKA